MPAIPDTSAIRPGDAAETVGVVIIHGVGETEPGWIDEFLIPHLQKAEPQFVPDLHTRVVKLAEPVDEAQRTAARDLGDRQRPGQGLAPLGSGEAVGRISLDQAFSKQEFVELADRRQAARARSGGETGPA